MWNDLTRTTCAINDFDMLVCCIAVTTHVKPNGTSSKCHNQQACSPIECHTQHASSQFCLPGTIVTIKSTNKASPTLVVLTHQPWVG